MERCIWFFPAASQNEEQTKDELAHSLASPAGP